MKKTIAITLLLLTASTVIFSVISCGYDAGSSYLARGDYIGMHLARAYYKDYIIGIIILSIIFAIAGGLIAYAKNRSFIGWFLLCGFFWVIPLIVIASLSSNKDSSNNVVYNPNIQNLTTDKLKKCPFCAENIKSEAIICRFCNSNVGEHENIEKENKMSELKKKYNGIEDILSDVKFMEEARAIRRFYGKSAYVNKIQKKAEELGIKINENDIE